jgi:hypothetical protein
VAGRLPRELQDGVDAGHQPWLLSAESVALAYAQGELHLFGPMPSGCARRVPGPLPPWRVGGHRVLGLAMRHTNGVWVVTQVGDPLSKPPLPEHQISIWCSWL